MQPSLLLLFLLFIHVAIVIGRVCWLVKGLERVAKCVECSERGHKVVGVMGKQKLQT